MDQNRNPYVKEGERPLLRMSVVAYMDILGYRQMAKEASLDGTEAELLLQLHSALDYNQKFVKGDLVLPKLGLKDSHAVKAFTDNIVIGWPIHKDAVTELFSAFRDVSFFQFNMAMAGFFIRGGLSIGDLYMDDVTVFGGGFNEAYYAESSLARDPRVILAPSAEKTVCAHMQYYDEELCRDSDGKIFVDYLDNTILIAEHENGPFYEELMSHKQAVEHALAKYNGDPVKWSKYAWVANYHNYFCERYPQYFGDGHMIEERKLRMELRRITEA